MQEQFSKAKKKKEEILEKTEKGLQKNGRLEENVCLVKARENLFLFPGVSGEG